MIKSIYGAITEKHIGFLLGKHNLWRFSQAAYCYFYDSNKINLNVILTLLKSYRQYLETFGFSNEDVITQLSNRVVISVFYDL